MKIRTLLILVILSFVIPTSAFSATRLKDEGTSQGFINEVDCVGAGIACTKSGITGTITVGGGGSGDAVTANSTAIDTTANFKDNTSIQWFTVDGGAGGPDDILGVAISSDKAIALAGNGANCGAGEYPLGVNASGAAESCTDATTEITSYAQPLDADLTSIAGNSTGGFLTRTAADTYTARTIGEGTAIDVTNGDGVSGAPSIAWDSTEVEGTTWGAGAAASIAHVYNVSGTDVTATWGSASLGLGTTTTVTHGNLELGAASDTTLARSAAGRVTIEGVEIPTLAGRSLTATTNTFDADAELYTDTKCIYFENPTAADDFKSIWYAKQAATLTSIWAESDQTVTFMLQVDDGTPADVDTVDLAPAAGTAEDTSLNGDTTMAAGDRLDLDLVSVSGTPTRCSICWTFTYDD